MYIFNICTPFQNSFLQKPYKISVLLGPAFSSVCSVGDSFWGVETLQKHPLPGDRQRVLNLSFNLRAQICSWSKLPGCFNHQQKQNGTGLGAIHCWIQEFVATGVWKDCTSKRRRIITVTTIISTSILNRSQYCTWQPAWIWLANLVMSATL